MGWEEVIPSNHFQQFSGVALWVSRGGPSTLCLRIKFDLEVAAQLGVTKGDKLRVFNGEFKDRDMVRLIKLHEQEVGGGYRVCESGARGFLVSPPVRSFGGDSEKRAQTPCKYAFDDDNGLIITKPKWLRPKNDAPARR